MLGLSRDTFSTASEPEGVVMLVTKLLLVFLAGPFLATPLGAVSALLLTVT